MSAAPPASGLNASHHRCSWGPISLNGTGCEVCRQDCCRVPSQRIEGLPTSPPPRLSDVPPASALSHTPIARGWVPAGQGLRGQGSVPAPWGCSREERQLTRAVVMQQVRSLRGQETRPGAVTPAQARAHGCAGSPCQVLASSGHHQHSASLQAGLWAPTRGPGWTSLQGMGPFGT